MDGKFPRFLINGGKHTIIHVLCNIKKKSCKTRFICLVIIDIILLTAYICLYHSYQFPLFELYGFLSGKNGSLLFVTKVSLL